MKKIIKRVIIVYNSRPIRVYENTEISPGKFERIEKDNAYTWGDIKSELLTANIELKDSDGLCVCYEESFDDGDSAGDDQYSLIITRDMLETDEEFEERKTEKLRYDLEAKKRRHQNYLKLKNEFELET